MDLLLDTHTIIWFITENQKLPLATKQLIEDTRHNCFISIASYWEIAIKSSLGRLELGAELDNILQIIEDSGFELLPITIPHILANSNLKFHHHDPFDRILIAQAVNENLTIVTKDTAFVNYSIPLLWREK